jgi:hypothetical protein
VLLAPGLEGTDFRGGEGLWARGTQFPASRKIGFRYPAEAKVLLRSFLCLEVITPTGADFPAPRADLRADDCTSKQLCPAVQDDGAQSEEVRQGPAETPH